MKGNGDVPARGPRLRSPLGAILRRGLVKGQLDTAAARKQAAKQAQRARGVRGRQREDVQRDDWRRFFW